MLAKVFKINDGRITFHQENPTRQEFINYCKSLDDWGNMFVSLNNGEVCSLKGYLLSLID
jgi:hypothetical protein